MAWRGREREISGREREKRLQVGQGDMERWDGDGWVCLKAYI